MELDNLGIEIYIFGSTLYSENPNDVDILVIYTPIEQYTYKNAIMLRSVLSKKINAKLNLQADVVLLTREEERDLQYIKQVDLIYKI